MGDGGRGRRGRGGSGIRITEVEILWYWERCGRAGTEMILVLNSIVAREW